MTKPAKSSPPRQNRLAEEKSPYLLQHAENPVEWYPWGEEAFERARREDRPIFLSIGYSTCHWCHVMAHESFEDTEVADLMNGAFVNIKVDREERPDIDSVYMSVCQMMTGGGGWPLTIIMTPDRKPFFAGTYFPKEGRFGRAGMRDLVPALSKAWTERRAEVLESAAQITGALSAQSGGERGEAMDDRYINTTSMQLTERFDEEHGGFGNAPKFPSPHNLSFLLRYWRRADDEWSLEMVSRTLRAMRNGGVYDHIGYGFHRYSTDRRWLVPHFEKMLYDQAGLILVYTEAFQASGEEDFAETAEEIAQYVLRDLRSPEGTFYSAEDADSEGEEGKFYVWALKELKQVLGEGDAALAAKVWNAESEGNFSEEASGTRTGANILHRTASLEDLAGSAGLGVEELEGRIEEIRSRLFEARGKRIRPHLDDKVLVDWNGYTIAALAKAGAALEREDLVTAARQAADFILGTLIDDKGRLIHSWREGTATAPGHLDDYAFLVWGLLELYEATFEDGYLTVALGLNETMLQRFWDDEGGGLFLTPDDGEELLVRPKEAYDGAMPSGNSVAMHNLLRISQINADPHYEELAEDIARAFSTDVGKMPSGFTQMMGALDRALGGSKVVVIVGDPGAEDTAALMSALRTRYLPNKVALFRRADECSEGLAGCAPYLPSYEAKDGRATAYVCQRDMCKPPTHDAGQMLELLE